MSDQIPGYLTLKDAEERYGEKADTLKRKCQQGKIIGAKKLGKTWFVPNIPNVDPDKTIPENYPMLNFDAARISILSLYDAEDEAKLYLYQKNSQYVYAWEYGYYYVSLIFKHASLHKSYLPFAALVSEAYGALRGSFLLNLQGYHSDAYTLLRRTHESIVKALAGRKNPQKLWKFSFSKSIQSAEDEIGVDFSSMWRLGSSFAHSDNMKLFEAAKDMTSDKEEIGVSYGPQLDQFKYRAASNSSIFWLYVLTKSLPYIFSGQLSEYWLSLNNDSSKFLRDYIVSTGALKKELKSFDDCIDKLLLTK